MAYASMWVGKGTRPPNRTCGFPAYGSPVGGFRIGVSRGVPRRKQGEQPGLCDGGVGPALMVGPPSSFDTDAQRRHHAFRPHRRFHPGPVPGLGSYHGPLVSAPRMFNILGPRPLSGGRLGGGIPGSLNLFPTHDGNRCSIFLDELKRSQERHVEFAVYRERGLVVPCVA